MIDPDGYRPNVGIIVLGSPLDGQPQVLWAKRIGQLAWQFPQGGIKRDEQPEQACFRELEEELGLKSEQVRVLGVTHDWLHYQLPPNLVRSGRKPVCIGQKQKWFALQLLVDANCVRLDAAARPEFDAWQWINYWQPAQDVVFFKREVYAKALAELAPLVGAQRPAAPLLG